jgi:hypothetical protein
MSWKSVLALPSNVTGRLRGWRRVAKWGFAAVCVGGLAACAVQALQYSEPVDDQAAEFVVSTDGPMALLFYRDAARCTDALQVRQPKVGSTSYRIPANREFAFRFTYFSGSARFWTACPEQILSFIPEKGRQYSLHYTRDGDGAECRWTLTETDGGRQATVKTWEREQEASFTSFAGEGAWCKPKGM